MIKFLHTGDLHLKAPPDDESDYSLDCLKILLERAHAEAVDAILFCGDIFDKKSDYLDTEFRKKVVAQFDTAKSKIYYIPGNHEDHAGDFKDFKIINWGSRVDALSKVALLRPSENVEIVAIPHSRTYEKFAEWDLPKKNASHRIAMAHGEIPGFQFLGDEEGAGVLNSAIFLHHEISHVFLGHIHKGEELSSGGVKFNYAGSPRPVRSRENGIRSFNIIQIADGVSVIRKELPEVGVVRNLGASVLMPDWDQELVLACRDFSKNDRVYVELSGMVQDLSELQPVIEKLKKNILEKCRSVKVNQDGLSAIKDLLENPFYKKVYELWLTKSPSDKTSREYQVWLRMLDSLKFVKEEVI